MPAPETKAERFQALLEQARTDPNILAFWLGGSRGQGFATEHSDYDCGVLVTEPAFEAYQAALGRIGHMDVDVVVMTLEQLRAAAAWGAPDAWSRYDFVRLRPLVDKTGLVQPLFDEKARIPDEHLEPFVAARLDAFVNAVYRSIKCTRDGRPIAARLEAGETIQPLLDALFALHGGRLRPYHKYLERELAESPLEHLPWPPTDFLDLLLQVLSTADVAVLQELLRETEPLARARGYGLVFDAWGQALPWMLAFTPEPDK